MLALLVLFAGLLLATAADKSIPKDTNYVIRQNATCPSSGFFFQREVAPNHLGVSCQLCFCQSKGTAVCWGRENRKCDLEHFQDFGQRNSRTRRSPLSLGEVFLRDAARDFFDKQSPEQCKPFESSFSDGCPPADWCIGCTVCDCDANGHWDCHVLSFCTDKNGKKQMKKRRGPPRSRHAKKQSKKSTTKALQSTKITTKPPKKPARKRSANPNVRNNQVKKSSAVNKHKINQVKGTTVNKIAPVKKPLRKVQTKKAVSSRNKVTRRPIYIKKKVSTNKPLNIKSNSDKSVKNNTIDVAQKVVKQFMSTMQKMIKNIDNKSNTTTTKQMNKVLRKRSMPQQDSKNTKRGEKKLKFVTKPALNGNRKDFGNRNIPKSYNSNSSNHGRIKRQVTIVEDVSHKNDSTYLYKWNENKTDENGKNNSSQNWLIDNSTSSVLNIPQVLNNKTANLTLLKNSMGRDIYITDKNIYISNKQSMIDGETFYHNVNNTDTTVLWAIDNYIPPEQNISNIKVENISFLTTSRPFLSSYYTLSNNTINNGTGSKENLPDEMRFRENMVYEKEKKYSIASTQTENHNCKFRTLLEKLIGKDTDHYYNRNESYETAKKPKRYTILTKIKRLFRKIFNKKNRNPFYHKENFYYSDSNIKQFYSKKPQDYKLNSDVKEKLRQRIYELKSESENLLKTIGIIKGLLHILEINTNETQFKGSNHLHQLNKNIDKLKVIVKNSYYTGENAKKLTEDQRTQINYIKDNVQEFIKSIGKFARILDDVIRIAMYYNKKEHKIDNAKRNESINVINKIVKDDHNNMTYAKVEKLKKLILDYNILQNKFIHQIYVILNNLDAKITNNSQPTVRYMDLNKTDAIETNSANIIKNIRKLKLLAESMNLHKRPKRATVDDNEALEYLLILMEYMLKRHKPSHSSVYDGLDLIIEAIKNAPDIKVIKIKALDNTTKNTLVTRTTVPMNWFKKYNNYSVSNTAREHKNDSPDTNKGKIKTTDHSEDDVDNDEDKIEEIYRSFKSNKYSSTEQKQDDMVLRANSMSITSDSYDNLKEATTRTSRDNNFKVVQFKPVHYSLEEEITTSPRAIALEIDTTSSPLTGYGNIINDNSKNEVKGNSNIENFLVDAKANIDWIEENFKEIKQLNELNIMSTTAKTLLPTRSYKSTENRSDNTNEDKMYNEKKSDVSSTEEIMSKKQLDLLNSLDYVEDETDSKDDKFLSDTYV